MKLLLFLISVSLAGPVIETSPDEFSPIGPGLDTGYEEDTGDEEDTNDETPFPWDEEETPFPWFDSSGWGTPCQWWRNCPGL